MLVLLFIAPRTTPLTFSAYNFQTVIRSPDDLWKFADSQQEGRASYYCNKVSKFSFEELQLIRSVSFLYGNYQKQFDRDFNPVGLNGQLSSIPSLRVLESLEKKLQRKPIVFEIGFGSGLLGHLCKSKGYKYIGYDITQSFYLYNSVVFSDMYGADFFDAFDVDSSEAMPEHLYTSDITLIPWWLFLDTSFKLPKFDVVVMNHCFNEMSIQSLRFTLSRLSNGSSFRIPLCVSQWGDPKYSQLTNEAIRQLEDDFDFQLEPLSDSINQYKSGTVLLSFKSSSKLLGVVDKNYTSNKFMSEKPNRFLLLSQPWLRNFLATLKPFISFSVQ